MSIKSVALGLLILTPLALSVPTPSNSNGQGPTSFDLPISKRGLERRSLTNQDRLAALAESQRRVKRKYGIPVESEEALVRRGVDVPMGGSQADYFADIVVGTPPIAYAVILDTGSSDLVLATAQVANLCGSTCKSTAHRYNPAQSSTSKDLFTSIYIPYGIGSANGTLYSDTMTFAGYTGTQNLVAAFVADDYDVTPDEDGLLGLALQPISASGSTPFVEALYMAGVLEEPLFGMALAQVPEFQQTNSAKIVSGGVLTIGGTNSAYYSGAINYISLSDTSGFWNIALEGIAVNGNSLGITFPSVTIDTGTNSITIPQSAANAIYEAIPGAQVLDATNGFYSFPCSSSIQLTFAFGEATYTVNPTAFNLGPVNSGGTICQGAVFSGGSGGTADDTWVIGSPFLESVYTSYRFNPPAVGFATLVDTGNILENGVVPVSNGTSNSGSSSGSSSGSGSSSSTASSVFNKGSLAIALGGVGFAFAFFA